MLGADWVEKQMIEPLACFTYNPTPRACGCWSVGHVGGVSYIRGKGGDDNSPSRRPLSSHDSIPAED